MVVKKEIIVEFMSIIISTFLNHFHQILHLNDSTVLHYFNEILL